MVDFTPLMRLYARRRLAKLRGMVPGEVQQRILLSLLARAGRTRFGRDHGFAEIRSVPDFQSRVPLRRYEDFAERYWSDEAGFPVLHNASWPGTIPYFAVTSGTTTGRTKYIPFSREMITSATRAAVDTVCFHLADRPKSRVLGGKSFMLGGSTAFAEEAHGVHSGDMSGIMADNLPWWASRASFPPQELALLADWEEKIERLAEVAASEDIRTIAGTPSWLLLFFDRMAALRREDAPVLAKYFPNLELLVHGGVDFAPYRQRFEALLADTHAELREVYPASEGFFAAADQGSGEGLRLMLDGGIFYEFVPVEELGEREPTRHWAGTVQKDVNYAIAVSTCAGLWAYLVGDTVEVVDYRPLRVRVTGRISYTLSAFGEHLIAHEIEEAVARAAKAIGADVTDWSVGAVFPDDTDAKGGHIYIVEFAHGAPDEAGLAGFAATLDAHLCETNEDYEAHRSGGFGMAAPEVRAVAPGTFAEWMKARGQLGGQHKVPRIINNAELFAELRSFADRP